VGSAVGLCTRLVDQPAQPPVDEPQLQWWRVLEMGTRLLVLAILVVARAATTTVEVFNFEFEPTSVSVNLGDTIEFSITSGTHSLASGNCSASPPLVWSSPSITTPGTFNLTINATNGFVAPGTYEYHDGLNLCLMGSGVIQLLAPSVTGTEATTAPATSTSAATTQVASTETTTASTTQATSTETATAAATTQVASTETTAASTTQATSTETTTAAATTQVASTETTAATTAATETTGSCVPVGCIPEDLQRSAANEIDAFDLNIFLANWGPCVPDTFAFCTIPCGPDFNRDGLVNSLDLVNLLTSWGAVPACKRNH